MPTANIPAAVSGSSSGWRYYPYPYYQTIGPNGLPITILPPMPPVIMPAVLVPVAVPQPPVPNGGNFGLAGPLPRRGVPVVHAQLPATKKKADPARANQLVTYGDRLFRGGNTRKAEERYEQAARANPSSAAPQVRLAQLALVRGLYSEAADHLRAAQTAEPGWITNVDDVQSIYSEPADFAKQIARLESHLQATPGDRDAWLVLGAQWFLSGRTQKAADIFLRLSDRQPDATLEAFLEASRSNDPAPVR
ncbi:tetratricopeptide repeat protein [Singulisphaera sp. GP187]|uniref:tetratricopeptide repeat protein n=1 Tax=Singulisphaera sp. GP187 TaxID=1882752 RepID=UPI000941984C|nr:tetratricopeptide repeat protein [Singulisphaera sp. GP187]